jgi:hypothetical protein
MALVENGKSMTDVQLKQLRQWHQSLDSSVRFGSPISQDGLKDLRELIWELIDEKIGESK